MPCAGPLSNAVATWNRHDVAMAFVSAGSLSTLFEPLTAAFGPGVTMRRDGNSVRWSFAGLAAFVEAEDESTIRATFEGDVARDGASHTAVAPIYRAQRAYAFSGDGASLLAADLVAFFSGTREPYFVFSGFRQADLRR